MVVDTPGGRYHVEWNESAPMTPSGQLVFFAQFLEANELFSRLCEDAPFDYTSPNAPKVRDVLGTILLSALAGHSRYAHMTALRFDDVTPGVLGMSKVVSEDSARRSLGKLERERARKWQRDHMRACWVSLLCEPWILDIDSTVKLIYGRQEGAEVGYNSHKPGRPSHTYHTYWMAKTRICLDVEVRPGNQHAGKHGMPALWELIDSLPREKWPHLLRGDCGYGNQANMSEAEERGINYLFKLRQSTKVKRLIGQLEKGGAWCDAGKGFQGTEALLRLDGWDKQRRVIVLRRMREVRNKKPGVPLLAGAEQWTFEQGAYEYAILVTNLTFGIEASAQLYRDRADSENPFDELKNQWGWGGFVTHDLARCQIIARYIALIYNWWSLFVRLLCPHKHSEAITSRPMMMGGVARQTTHAGQKKLHIGLTHGKSEEIKKILRGACLFLQGLIEAAEQLSQPERWRRMLSRIFEKFLRGRPLACPVPDIMGG